MIIAREKLEMNCYSYAASQLLYMHTLLQICFCAALKLKQLQTKLILTCHLVI